MYNPCHSYLYLLVRCQRRQYSLLKEGVVSYHPDRVAVSVSMYYTFQHVSKVHVQARIYYIVP